MIKEIIENLFNSSLPQDIIDWLSDATLIRADIGDEIVLTSGLMSVPSTASFITCVEKRVYLPPESPKEDSGTTMPDKHETRSQGQQLSLF